MAAGRIAREGTVGDRRRVTVDVNAAAVAAGRIAREGTVGDRRRATGDVNAAAVIGRVAGEGAV